MVEVQSSLGRAAVQAPALPLVGVKPFAALAHVAVNVDAARAPRRAALGTLQGGMSREQLDYYCDEYVFRFNRRASRSRGLLFYRLIEQGVVTEPHPYRNLLTPQIKLL
jgi:hypothetical protein